MALLKDLIADMIEINRAVQDSNHDIQDVDKILKDGEALVNILLSDAEGGFKNQLEKAWGNLKTAFDALVKAFEDIMAGIVWALEQLANTDASQASALPTY